MGSGCEEGADLRVGKSPQLNLRDTGVEVFVGERREHRERSQGVGGFGAGGGQG